MRVAAAIAEQTAALQQAASGERGEGPSSEDPPGLDRPQPMKDPAPRVQKIFFASRTHSQIAQVVRELKVRVRGLVSWQYLSDSCHPFKQTHLHHLLQRTPYKPKMAILVRVEAVFLNLNTGILICPYPDTRWPSARRYTDIYMELRFNVQAARTHYCINKAVVKSGRVDEECDSLIKDGHGCRFHGHPGGGHSYSSNTVGWARVTPCLFPRYSQLCCFGSDP